jgi:hypothetical protein
MTRRLRVRSSIDARLNAPVALSLTCKAVPAIMNGELMEMQAARRDRLSVSTETPTAPTASESPVSLVTCHDCGCDCRSDEADIIHDYKTYLAYAQDYSAEWSDEYCPTCLARINDEYQPVDPVDVAYDAWIDRRA